MIRNTNDVSLHSQARRYTRTAERIAAHRQHLAFNLQIKRYGLMPRSLEVRLLVHSQEGREIARQTSRHFLKARILQNVRNVLELEYDLFFQRQQLEFHLQAPHAEALEEVRTRIQQERTEKCKEQQKRNPSHPRHPNDKWVVNLSSRPLSVAEKGVLARGLNFAPAPKGIPVPEIITAVESGLSKVCPPEAQLTRTRIAGCLARSKPPPNNLFPEEQKAIKALREALSLPPRTREMPQSSWTRLRMMGRSRHCLLTSTHIGGSQGTPHKPWRDG